MIKRLIRILIITISVLIAYKLYIISYYVVIDKHDFEVKLSEHLEQEVIVESYEDIDGGYNIYFTFDDGTTHYGLALLKEGLNSKYRIAEVTFSEDESRKNYGFLTTSKIDYEGKQNGGPEGIVLISCALVILIGFIISLLFTPNNNLLERIFYRIFK